MADVGCAGILVADTFCGPMPRLPHQGELLPVGDMPSRAGGCAANVALDLVKQRLAVEVFGCLGRDSAAEVLLGAFRAAGVACEHLGYSQTLPTSRTVILLVEGEDRRYVHTFGTNAAFTAKHIPRQRLHGLKVLYVGGLFAMPGLDPQELASVLAYCRANSIATVLDVVVPPSQAVAQEQLKVLLPHVDCFLPNDDEAQLISGSSDVKEQIELFQQYGAKLVVITRGASGAVGRGASRSGRCRRFASRRWIPPVRATRSRPGSSPGW